eukprot:TRINITY_DN10360_c0_g1_i1.p1 TRINITY_DN10360_c0_g1~~TRINITY_DN10360_c0_g1_i1.p1  ORF type:complete len:222 (+),score=72.08 TRINITY_DN10360_c0_g1_i1:235-900(+)
MDAIGATNRGYRLLQKMGWKEGTGLGRQEQGRLEPIILIDDGSKLGLGKTAEWDHNATEATKERLKLDSELTLEEHRIKRQDQAERTQKIEAEVTAVTDKFNCKLCNKQYKTYMQYQEHLDSYDHHHKKRFEEMKTMMKGTATESKAEREQRRAAKEMQAAMKLAANVAKAEQSAQPRAGGMMARPASAAVSMSFGGIKKHGLAKKKAPPRPAINMDFDDD